jgi:hypothetical protein
VSALTRWAVPVYSPVRLRQVTQTISGLEPSNLTHYSLDCQPATYTVSGTTATLITDRMVNAEPGVFTLTGTAATLVFDRPLNAGIGAYTVSGADASLIADRMVDAAPGSFTVSGFDVTLTRSFDLDASPGSYTVTGVDATFEYTVGPAAPPNTAIRAVPVHSPKPQEQVSQTISGLAPSAAYEINAEPAAFTITGVAAELTHNVPDVWDRIVSPNYAHTTPQIIYGSRVFYGVEEAALVDYELDCQPGSVAVTGVAASLVAARLISADPGSYAVTGVNASLDFSGAAASTARHRTLMGVGV